ncbi:MAG: uroporphyrinogen-III C-methyltransferase [Pseudomonadota bacterium]|jgi:uroporphyrin-III C-methyltransferase
MPDLGAIDLPEFMPGTVWLTGAGPGDPGLLTLLGLHGIRHADAIVYDALVNPEILNFARKDVELIYAGKRGGRPSASQPDISGRLVQLAKSGKRVLRLKGGDPFVFGRGGEEALALTQNAVSFRIVPGISAGIGGLAYAGIPVTFRTINSVVTFLTGHDAGGEVPSNLDWRAIAAGSPVIVIYMALRQIGDIAEKLLSAGREGSTAVALVSKATSRDQQIILTDLAHCAAAARDAQLQPPAMIVVGPVAQLHAQLDWFRTWQA